MNIPPVSKDPSLATPVANQERYGGPTTNLSGSVANSEVLFRGYQWQSAEYDDAIGLEALVQGKSSYEVVLDWSEAADGSA
jgi:hypothetical protein